MILPINLCSSRLISKGKAVSPNRIDCEEFSKLSFGHDGLYYYLPEETEEGDDGFIRPRGSSAYRNSPSQRERDASRIYTSDTIGCYHTGYGRIDCSENAKY
jgi:hypothetical protein